MRALTVEEIDLLAQSLNPLLGCRLQEVVVGRTGVGLGFWTGGQGRGEGVVWLWFEAHTWSPVLLPLTKCPEAAQKPLKPLALFLRAHFLDHSLKSIQREANLGRALILDFSHSDEDPRTLEVDLWPHGANLIAKAEKRGVTWTKSSPSSSMPVMNPPPARNLSQILDEWQVRRENRSDKGRPHPPLQDQKTKSQTHWQQEYRRLERAIQKVQEEIQSKQAQPFREVGNWIKEHQTLDVPIQWSGFVDKRRKLAWNLESCFYQAKEIERKLESTLDRLHTLNQQMQNLKAIKPEDFQVEVKQSSAAFSKKSQERTRFRSLHLPEGLTARIGKTGADNAQLLRSARSWDFWLHLRDFPGSHAILSRERKQMVSDDILRQVGVALVEQSFGKKQSLHRGEKFELIVTECRYVRAIKGAKPGLVTYTHERILGFRLG